MNTSNDGSMPVDRARIWLAYAGMLGCALGAFALIRAHGESLAVGEPNGVREVASGSQGSLIHLLLALALVIAVARIAGTAFERWLRQPAVIGETVAGILLGPSVLGAIAPGVQAFALPASIVPNLTALANIGVILFMFLIGLELDLKALAGKSRAMVMISHASIVVPFLLGGVMSLWLFARYTDANVEFTSFALFCGLSLSVTAFPVLVRILASRDLQSTALGNIALVCAAVDDVTAWCLLAIVASLAQSKLESAVWTLALALVYVAGMLWVIRPRATRWVARLEAGGGAGGGAFAAVLCAVFLSALATEAIGIHALFGAFSCGAILPHQGKLAECLRHRLEQAVVIVFLPLFFVCSGLKTQVGLVGSLTDWVACLAIVAIATLGKFGGTYIAARCTGLPHVQALVLGTLMNTRGLMELIVLNIGLDMGLLSPKLFAMLVIMALATTALTGPLLNLFLPRLRELATRRPSVEA